MNVWIANPFDNLPLEGYRPQRYWLMARAFARAGHDVTYWTSDFSHALKAKRKILHANPEPRIGLRFVPTPPYKSNVCLARVASHMALARKWRSLAQAETRKPDIAVASMPPLGLCGEVLRFAHASGAVAIVDVMDAWPETFERIVPRPLLAPLRRAAGKIYNSADAVSAVASRYIDLAKSYGASAPAKLFYHGIEIDARPPRREARRDGMFRLAYIGSMGASYDLETAIVAVKATPRATFDIAGGGPKEALLRKTAGNCDRIHFHGYLDSAGMKKLLAGADAGLVPMLPESCVGVPYKLADYAAAGLRVAECLGGETQALVERFHAGLHYKPRDPASLARCMAELAAGTDAEWDPGGFADGFNAENIMSDYVRWTEGLCASGA